MNKVVSHKSVLGVKGQPIETAPRDGIQVLVFCADREGYCVGTSDSESMGGQWLDCGAMWIKDPIYWWPLPAEEKNNATGPLYYQTPSDDLFESVKRKCLSLWSDMDGDRYEIEEAIERINGMRNIRDNMMYIVAMFSSNNLAKLSSLLTDDERIDIFKRITSVKGPEAYYFRGDRS